MVVKVYVSGSSGNKEVKKRQQKVLLILDSKSIKYEVIDIAEPNMEEQKQYMQTNAKQMGGTIGDPNPRHALPPQIFNDDVYCGDYDSFDMANEVDEMEKFLKLDPIDTTVLENKENIGNGEAVKEKSPEKLETDDEKLESNVQETKLEEETAAGDQKNETDDQKNETDDQKIENGSKDEVVEEETNETIEETEKSEEA